MESLVLPANAYLNMENQLIIERRQKRYVIIIALMLFTILLLIIGLTLNNSK